SSGFRSVPGDRTPFGVLLPRTPYAVTALVFLPRSARAEVVASDFVALASDGRVRRHVLAEVAVRLLLLGRRVRRRRHRRHTDRTLGGGCLGRRRRRRVVQALLLLRRLLLLLPVVRRDARMEDVLREVLADAPQQSLEEVVALA